MGEERTGSVIPSRKARRLAVVLAGLALGCWREPEVVVSTPEAAAPTVRVAPVARVETTDEWIDLLVQRPSAVVLRDGAVVVDLGSEAARKHVNLGTRSHWALAQRVDDRRAGVVINQTGTLEIPLDGPLAPKLHPDTPEHAGLALALELRPLAPDQTVTVLWNERPLANLHLRSGWERRTLSLPGDLVKPGENRLRLHFRRVAPWQDGVASAALARVEVGTHARITAPTSGPGIPAYTVEAVSGRERGIRLYRGSALVYYLVPPRRGRLRLDVRGAGAMTVRVSTDVDHREGKAPTVLHDEPLRATGQRAELDLSAWGGVPIRLELAVRGTDPQTVAQVDGATVAVERTVPVDRRARKPRDLVVLAVEGARADVLAVGERPPLPAFDALMAESMVFERAYALSPAAVPSHASWWTSMTPPVHLTVRGTFVAEAQVALAESVSRLGYFRALVSANEDVNTDRGLLQGFDVHRVLGDKVEDDGATAVVRTLLDEVRGRSGPWLLYANVNDPQAPYEPPGEFLRDLSIPAGAPLPHLTHIWVGRVRLGKSVPSKEELEYVHRLYRGEMQVVDRALGELVAALEREGRLADAILVVVGVHGEEIYEHQGAGHGRTLYEESLRVPLIIRAPAVLAPGRVDVPVDLLDLAPTLADLMGVESPARWMGESLVPLIDDPHPPPRLVVGYLGDGSRSALVGAHKLVLGPGWRERYFDLGTDPRELHDRVDEGGIGLRLVRTALTWQLAHEPRWRRARWGTGANLRAAFALDHGM